MQHMNFVSEKVNYFQVLTSPTVVDSLLSSTSVNYWHLHVEAILN